MLPAAKSSRPFDSIVPALMLMLSRMPGTDAGREAAVTEDEDRAEKVRKNRVRRMLARQGRTLHKCRHRDPRAIGYGLYHVAEGGVIVYGGHTCNGYDMTRDDCEAFARGFPDEQ